MRVGHAGRVLNRLVLALSAVLTLAVATVGAVLFARSVGPLSADALDTPYDKVLYDSGASAEQVVAAAGAPHEVVELDDGTEVRLYTIRDQEGGEAEQAAVQVRTPGRSPVTRRVSSSWDLAGGGERAVLHTDSGLVSVVDPDGGLRPVTRETTGSDGRVRLVGIGRTSEVRRGDVLVGVTEPRLLFRPSSGRVLEWSVPATDREEVSDVAVRDGRAWVAGTDAAGNLSGVRWSDDGRQWIRKRLQGRAAPEVVPSPDGRSVAVTTVDAAGGSMGSTGSLHVVDAGGELRAVALPSSLGESSVGWTPDGRVLLGNGDDGWWRLDEDGWHRLATPGGVESMGTVGDRLWAFGSRPPADAAWRSDDDGDRWTRVR